LNYTGGLLTLAKAVSAAGNVLFMMFEFTTSAYSDVKILAVPESKN